MSSFTANVEPSIESYVRNARRLRAQFANEPAKLLTALRDLSPRQEETDIPLSAPREFARLVAEKMQAGLLRYSTRLSLLKQAKKMGIQRFDANLIIAAVQSRMPKQTAEESKPRRTWVPILATFIIVQSAILIAAWLLLG